VNHLERPDAGFVQVAGELVGYRYANGRLHELRHSAVTRQRSRIGMLFQQFNLFPHRTVLENIVEAPIAVRGLSRPAAVAETHEIGFAREVADTVVFLDGGRIVESGPPADVLTRPSNERARAFLAAVL